MPLIKNITIIVSHFLNEDKTLELAHFIANKLKGKVVGSVLNPNKIPNDIDIRLENPDKQQIILIMNNLGYNFIGSSILSPQEIRKSKKKFGKGWQRIYHFQKENEKNVDVFFDELN